SNGINVAGRFLLFDSSGNPILDQPGIQFYQSPSKTLGSYVTVRIDGGSTRTEMVNGLLTVTNLPGWDLIWGDPGGNTGLTGTGAWSLAPFPVTDSTGRVTSIIASWDTIPVAAAPPKLALPQIRVEPVQTLNHDLTCVKFIVQNNDTVQHSVGLRMAQEIGVSLNNGIILPDGRRICAATSLSGQNLPASWRAVSDDQFAVNTPVQVGGVLVPNSVYND